jgi:hypothetical protein
MRNFRELEIWKEAITFTKKVYELSKDFPSDEKYGLTTIPNAHRKLGFYIPILALLIVVKPRCS